MRIIIVLTVLIFLANSSNAQYVKGGGGAFSIGMQTLQVDGLELFDPNSATLSSTNFSLGGYGYWQFNSWLFGFKGAGVYGSKVATTDYEYSLVGGYFMLDFGYKVINKNSLFVYPFIGVGRGGVAHNINSKATIDFSDPVNDKPAINSGVYNWSNVVFDIGVRIEKLFGIREEEKGNGGGLIGVEIGYMLSPSNTKWRTNTNAVIIGAPEYSMNGVYARIVIGGFGGY
jgi:hypothetical protein